MASILRQRRDTAANWSTNNPVIPDGQLVFATDTDVFKIGDGSTNYNSLDVVGSDGADGADGNTWLSGSGAPASGLGLDGDFYLRTDDESVYKKASGSWSVLITTLSGADGQDGDLLSTVENSFTADQTFEAITETVTAKSAGFTPDLTNDGTIFNVTGGVAVTMPTAENGKSFTIVASAPVSSWAGATIKWSGGTVPAGTGIVIYTFVASGSQWYGFEAGNAFA